jgi:hypothetical protein
MSKKLSTIHSSYLLPTGKTLSKLLLNLPIFATIGILGCGGGGGEDSPFVGAALVNIDAVPRKTDPGKRVRITTRINEVHPDGIFLKIKFPEGFTYAQDTARFNYRESERRVQPQVNLTSSQEGVVYLIFNLPRPFFGEDNEATLTLELNAETEVQAGKVAVDVDVNDPTIADSVEFSIDNPEFDTLDDIEIEVRGR